MKILFSLIFLLSLTLNFAQPLQVLPTILPLDSSQGYFSNHQLISQGEFQQQLDLYNQQAKKNQLQSAKYSLILTKKDSGFFRATFTWNLSYKSFDPSQSLALIPRSWILINNSSLQDTSSDSKHFKLPLQKQMKGKVEFIVQAPGYFELPPVALTEVQVINGDQFTLSNPYNKQQSIDLSNQDTFACGGLNSLQISNTIIKEKPIKKTDLIEKIKPTIKVDSLQAAILTRPLYQVDVKKNEIVIQGRININVLHQKIYSIKHSFSKDLQLKRLSFDPSIPFNFDSEQIIFPDGFMGQISLNFIQSIPKKQLSNGFLLPHLQNVQLFKGILYFISSENVKINSIDNSNLVDLPYLKDQSLDNYNLPILKSFEFHQNLGKIQLKTKSFTPQKSSQLKVLDTNVSSILTEEFRLANSYSFKVSNLGASNFVFDIPPQVQFLGSYINNKPVKPFRNDKAQIAINLPKEKHLTIAIKTLETLEKSHQLSLYMPTKEESLRTRWNFYFPKALNIQAIDSNLSFKKANQQNPIQNYSNYVLQKFFKSSSSTFQTIVVIFTPLVAIFIFLKLLVWIFSRFTSKIKWISLLTIVVLIIISILTMASFTISGSDSLTNRSPRSQFTQIDKDSSFLEEDFNQSLSKELFDADDFEDDFAGNVGGLAEGLDTLNSPARLKGRKNLYAPPAPPRPSKKLSKYKEAKAYKQKHDRQSKQMSSIAYGKRTSAKAYERKAIQREKKSKYKKIRKSGVKPVEIQFPKLSSHIKFGKNTPIDGLVYIKLSIKDFKKSNSLFISSMFSLLYLGLFIYLEKKQKLGLLGFLSLVMILSPAGQFMFMKPEPLFFVLAIIMINSFARICKNSMVILSILLCFQSTHASKAHRNSNLQALKSYQSKIMPVPQSEKVFTIFDFKKNDFSYDQQILVKDHLLKKIQKTNTKDQNLVEVKSQSILLEPDFADKKLNIFYTFTISEKHDDNFYLLRLHKKSLISQCIDQHGNALSLDIRYKSGSAYLYIKDFVGESIHLQVQSPLISKNYGDDFYNDIRLALTATTTIDYKKKLFYLKVSDAIKYNQQYFLSSKQSEVSLHFSKYPFKKEKIKTVQKQKTYNRYVNSRVKNNGKSKIHFSQKIAFTTPYIIVNNFVTISNKSSFQLRLPKNSTLSQFQIRKNYTSLTQGKDYSLSYKDDSLQIDLLESYSNLSISYRHFQTQNNSNFFVPFNPLQFKETIFKLEKETKEGQDIQFELQESLSQTASKSYQSKVLEFENLPQDLNKKAQFQVKVKSKSFVSFSKTQCISYKIENYMLSKKQLYQKLVLTLSNKESQFLELTLPEGTILEEALIDGKHLNIVKKDDKNLLLPLKKYKSQRNFNITLLLKARLNQNNGQFKIQLPSLKTDIKNLYFALTTDKNMYHFSDENPIRIQQKGRLNQFNQRVKSSDSFDFKFPRGRYYYVGARNGVDSQISILFEEIPEKKETKVASIDYLAILSLLCIAIMFQLSLPFFKVRIALSIGSILLISTLTGSLQYFYLTLIIAYLGYINQSDNRE